jgi:hypothetical protein
VRRLQRWPSSYGLRASAGGTRRRVPGPCCLVVRCRRYRLTVPREGYSEDPTHMDSKSIMASLPTFSRLDSEVQASEASVASEIDGPVPHHRVEIRSAEDVGPNIGKYVGARAVDTAL